MKQNDILCLHLPVQTNLLRHRHHHQGSLPYFHNDDDNEPDNGDDDVCFAVSLPRFI